MALQLMLRILLINALMFALPFVIYGAYFFFARKEAGNQDIWTDAPVLWLLGAGAILVFGAMITLVSFSSYGPDGTYVPPRIEDGVIKPGYIE